MTSKILCPKCGSEQISANKKGFSGGKALIGGLLMGPIGLAVGALGRNKIKVTCLNCAATWDPGEGKSETIEKNLSYEDHFLELLKFKKTEDAKQAYASEHNINLNQVTESALSLEYDRIMEQKR